MWYTCGAAHASAHAEDCKCFLLFLLLFLVSLVFELWFAEYGVTLPYTDWGIRWLCGNACCELTALGSTLADSME